MKNLLFWLAALLLGGCGAAPILDTMPPRLVDTKVSSDGRELSLEFDEPVTEAKARVDAAPKAPAAKVEGGSVKVPLPSGLKPGKNYHWSAEVKDKGNNLTSVAGRFYGPNDHPATLRLNEVRVTGSGAHTDFVELRVESGGSLGGWTIDALSGPESKQRTVLPDVAVSAGDFVVVHYKPTGDAAEKNETQSPDSSGGSDADPAAWDFWQADGKGLSGVKGLLALRARPDGPVADALLYSQKRGEAAPLAEAAGWAGREELDPSGCTATRTWCRTDDAVPVWMTVANGHASPGKPNQLTPWAGPTSSRSKTPKTKGRRKRRPGARSLPTRPGVLWSRPKPAAAAEQPGRARNKAGGRGAQTGTNPLSPENRGLPTRAGLRRTAIHRFAAARWGRGQNRSGGRTEEPPPIPSGPSSEPPLPGNGPIGCRRQAAATPSG